jgi:hypothetical protein
LSYIFPLTLSMRHERFDRRLKDSHWQGPRWSSGNSRFF